jgi:hypothetical protein
MLRPRSDPIFQSHVSLFEFAPREPGDSDGYPARDQKSEKRVSHSRDGGLIHVPGPRSDAIEFSKIQPLNQVKTLADLAEEDENRVVGPAIRARRIKSEQQCHESREGETPGKYLQRCA